MAAKFHLLFVSLKGSVFGVHHDPCQHHVSGEVLEPQAIRSKLNMLDSSCCVLLEHTSSLAATANVFCRKTPIMTLIEKEILKNIERWTVHEVNAIHMKNFTGDETKSRGAFTTEKPMDA